MRVRKTMPKRKPLVAESAGVIFTILRFGKEKFLEKEKL